MMMEIAQLEVAHKYYALNHAPRRAMVVSLENVRKVIGNQLKMPAGGAHAGGSMQTGFDMELISAAAVRTLFSAWPKELREDQNGALMGGAHDGRVRLGMRLSGLTNWLGYVKREASPTGALAGSKVAP